LNQQTNRTAKQASGFELVDVGLMQLNNNIT